MDSWIFRGVGYGLSGHYVVGVKMKIQKEWVTRRGQEVKNVTRKVEKSHEEEGRRHLREKWKSVWVGAT